MRGALGVLSELSVYPTTCYGRREVCFTPIDTLVVTPQEGRRVERGRRVDATRAREGIGMRWVALATCITRACSMTLLVWGRDR